MTQTSTRMPRKDICNTLAAERTIWIDANRESVWYAITDAKQLDQWYAPGSTWEMPTLKVGATVWFHHLSSETLTATIDVYEPMDEFVLRWQPDKTYPELVLVTTFFLEAEAGGTRVTINECGYSALPAEIRQEWVDGTNEGYGMSMENLKAHVEGRRIPHLWTPPSSQP
jgi:uncharacterized protein YndB with AHSA1/START domain